MLLPMPVSLKGSTPHPTLLLIHLVPVKFVAPAIYHPYPPKMIPKVSPQSQKTLRMVTPLKQYVVAPKLSSFLFFNIYFLYFGLFGFLVNSVIFSCFVVFILVLSPLWNSMLPCSPPPLSLSLSLYIYIYYIYIYIYI